MIDITHTYRKARFKQAQQRIFSASVFPFRVGSKEAAAILFASPASIFVRALVVESDAFAV